MKSKVLLIATAVFLAGCGKGQPIVDLDNAASTTMVITEPTIPEAEAAPAAPP